MTNWERWGLSAKTLWNDQLAMAIDKTMLGKYLLATNCISAMT